MQGFVTCTGAPGPSSCAFDYDKSWTTLGGYDESWTTLSGYDESLTVLSGYDKSWTTLSGYDKFDRPEWV